MAFKSKPTGLETCKTFELRVYAKTDWTQVDAKGVYDAIVSSLKDFSYKLISIQPEVSTCIAILDVKD